MKWLFCGTGIVLLVALFLAGCNKLRGDTSDDIDGGVVTRRSGDDAPKVIESTDIRSFSCVISLLAAWEPGELGNHVYIFEAERKEEMVVCTYQWYGRGTGGSDKITFEADGSFLESLQKIVSEYDLAQYNGFYHSVSGLPDMFGDRLSIAYDSGETIHASDNQRGFLPRDVLYDFYTLFGETCGKMPASLTITQSQEAVFERENNRLLHTAYPILSLSEEEQEKYLHLHDAIQTFNENLRTEYKTKLLRLRQTAQTVEGDFKELYAKNELFVTRSDSRILSFYEKREELEGWLTAMYWWDAHTFDAESGKELGFTDVFSDLDELPILLYFELMETYPELTFTEDTPEILKEAIREKNTAIVCFSLSPGCVHVFFTDYRLTSEHTGGQHITLSFEDYPELVRPEWHTSSVNQMFRLDFDVKYFLSDNLNIRMQYTQSADGTGGQWLCCVQDHEYIENLYNFPSEVYMIRKNSRNFLYLRVPTGDISMRTNVYEFTADGLTFVGQTDMAMAETVELNPDRIRMVRLEEREGIPVPIYGICKVSSDGMPVWFETIEQ